MGCPSTPYPMTTPTASAKKTATIDTRWNRKLIIARYPVMENQRSRKVRRAPSSSVWTESEIAATLGLSTGTVKSHASRGLAKMRALLGESSDAATTRTEKPA